ncbi:putative methyltransferase domain-containing protein [Rosellinia necatrix]|uniref:Putative methyltransferase domain-containing protein n=1 Tax=Rosellinia necatrix TaxID=77044 RepID=A0A1S8A5T6_ROSNE|nr:putative methyltransferase domain-containing protein [Rosellinia necatrix]
MGSARRPLPPSSSLPAIRSLHEQSESRILSALSGLSALYCPLPTTLAFQTSLAPKHPPGVADSGYASDNDDNRKGEDSCELRDDPYERSFAGRWLTRFLASVEELACFESEESRQDAIDKASSVLASFLSQEVADAEDVEITREYQFVLNLHSCGIEGHNASPGCETIAVQLTDGLAGRDNADHTDVGLQSWGAAFIFTELMCANPARLNLTGKTLSSSPRIIELGAGTGLVGIALGKVLPRLGVSAPTLVATDFHPTVLANLQANLVRNFPPMGEGQNAVPPLIQSAPLDWETPNLSAPPLNEQADVLVATDVVYDHKHAVWLRDCVARMLKPDGVFWLMLTVRTTGKFQGVSETVRASFNGRDGLRNLWGCPLMILDEENFARPNGIGRGDESEYRLFRIGWAPGTYTE